VSSGLGRGTWRGVAGGVRIFAFCRNVSASTSMVRGAETGNPWTVEFSEMQIDAIVESQARG